MQRVIAIAVHLSMLKSLIILSISVCFYSCNQKKATETALTNKEGITKTINLCDPEPTRTIEKDGIALKVYNFEALEPLLNQDCEKIHVINFWATWCKPCVAELPYFERLHTEKNIPVTLISLDMPNLIESKLIPFIKKENLTSKIVVLDDPDANKWIPKISPEWSGAIPATIIIKGDKRKFYEQSFTYETLNEAINTL